MDKPLISFVVLCYNQEAFIRDAVNGAFAQTYSPLEIIISDDCSKDRTFDIVRQMSSEYSGPHTVRINRNPANLGLSGNSNRAVALCNGELLVGAAGDDISLPERAALTFEAWEKSQRRATLIHSGFINIDEQGTTVDPSEESAGSASSTRFVDESGTVEGFLRRRKPHVNGCAYAMSRKLIELFGPLPQTVVYEDTANSFRTVLAGAFLTYINTPLVKYRRHRQNITFALHQKRPSTPSQFQDFQAKLHCELERFLPVYDCFAADAERAMNLGLISSQAYPAIRRRILYERRRLELRRDLLTQHWLKRLAIFVELYGRTVRPREMLSQTPHLLPKGLHRGIVTTLNRMSSSRTDVNHPVATT